MNPDSEAKHQRTVLLVDDERQVLNLLGRLLEKDGYRVLKAENAEEALERFGSQEFDAALIDLNLSGMDGLTLCRRLRENRRNAETPCILMSGVFDDPALEKEMWDGASDCITKPFRGAEVLLRVRNLIESGERREADFAHARKLEAVGRLAAGIAHEINTPTQFVGDSIHFLKEAFEDLRTLTDRYRKALDVVREKGDIDEMLARVAEAEEEADLEYLDENVPGSFERCIEGLSRIATIVGAMKDFAHPDQREKSSADLNQALKSTLTIARNESKYIADVETDFGELPLVPCYVGDLNQAFLNLIVNAAHAIGDATIGTGKKGLIRMRTGLEGGFVRIEIEDNGCGIPEEIRDRIFDPFFTTKEVGKGSGQGLAIARSVVVDKHGGALTCESRAGRGTTFRILLPVCGEPTAERENELR